MATESQRKALNKYKKAHIKRVPFDIQKSEYDYIKGFCDSKGVAVNAFIKQAIKEKIEHDKRGG